MLSGITILSKKYRHFKRYRQIVYILLKHGLGDLVRRLGLHRQLGFGVRYLSRKKFIDLKEVSGWEHLREALEEVGSAFVKLGQFASTRPDIVPAEACDELVKLQNRIPPFAFDKVREIVEFELGKSIEEVFDSFDEVAIASASIAQVHKAILKDGTVVAVKVQRPSIEERIEIDLEIMYHLATLVKKHVSASEAIDPVSFIDQFSMAVKKELDFNHEAGNMQRFRRNFKDEQEIVIPKPYREISSKRVLVMDFVEGVKISDVEHFERYSFDKKAIAKTGAEVVLKQIFIDGFFHADPHPGNFLVTADSKICMLDNGMTGTIAASSKKNLEQLIVAIVKKDPVLITSAFLKLSDREDFSDIEKLEADITDFVEQHMYLSLHEIRFGSLFSQMLNILMTHQIRMQPVYYLLFKSLITIEGNGRILDPDFDILHTITPFAKEVLKSRFSPSEIGSDIYKAGLSWHALAKDLPGDTRQIINQLKHGKVRLEFEHKGLEPMMHNHDMISNRIAFALVVSSMIVGSSLIVLSDIPPKWHGVPIIGLIGFGFAGLLGGWLILSILKHGKM